MFELVAREIVCKISTIASMIIIFRWIYYSEILHNSLLLRCLEGGIKWFENLRKKYRKSVDIVFRR